MKPSGQQIDQTLELRSRLLDLLGRYAEPRVICTAMILTVGQLLVWLSSSEAEAWSNLTTTEQKLRSIFGEELGKKWP